MSGEGQLVVCRTASRVTLIALRHTIISFHAKVLMQTHNTSALFAQDVSVCAPLAMWESSHFPFVVCVSGLQCVHCPFCPVLRDSHIRSALSNLKDKAPSGPI